MSSLNLAEQYPHQELSISSRRIAEGLVLPPDFLWELIEHLINQKIRRKNLSGHLCSTLSRFCDHTNSFQKSLRKVEMTFQLYLCFPISEQDFIISKNLSLEIEARIFSKSSSLPGIA